MRRICLGFCLLALLAGCITTDDREGDRGCENGFWRREGLAMWRVATSPVTIVSASAAPYRSGTMSTGRATFLCPYMAFWGLGETGEELVVGLTEMLTGQQFQSCAYPMERFRLDAQDWQPVRTAPASSKSNENPKPRVSVLLPELVRACERKDWQAAADLCRRSLSKSPTAGERVVSAVRLAMVCWNAGDRIGAVIAADVAVTACQEGHACREAVLDLANALRTRTAPTTFAADEILGRSGLGRRLELQSSAR